MTVELIEWPSMGAELAGEAAAVCTDGKHPEKSLLHSMESGHESVLEHLSYTFCIQGVSRVLLAQLTRHRIASFSVQSQRYVRMKNAEVIEPESIQGSEEAGKLFEEITGRAKEAYNRLLDLGIPAEDARYLLPQGVATKLYMTMNARELRHFFALRCCTRAQWEIRDLATVMLHKCQAVTPEVFRDAGPECLRTGCREGRRSCGKPWRKPA